MFGETAAGFIAKTLAEIEADLAAGWRAIFGNDVDLSPDTPDAQILGLVAGELDEAWQAIEAVRDSYRPSTAQGEALSEIVVFNGIQRDEGAFSRVVIVFDIDVGESVNIPADFQCSNPNGDVFQIIAPTNGAINGFSSLLVSVERAPIVIPTSETWEILTPIAHVNGVSNSLGGFVGSTRETDGELRARRRVSTQNPASNILESLYSGLLQVSGVQRARIYVNATSGVVDGRPAHSYETVVEGGTDADVAAAIWQRHPAGIELFGSTTENINDSQGFVQAIEFTRPTYVDILVEVTLSATADYPSTGDADIQQAIIDYANGDLVDGEGFGIGDDVLRTRLYSAINSVPGHHVTLLEIAASPGPVAEADVSIDEVELARFTIANITVTS